MDGTSVMIPSLRFPAVFEKPARTKGVGTDSETKLLDLQSTRPACRWGAIWSWRCVKSRSLEALVRHLATPLLLVWDRLPAHRSHLVRDFLQSLEGWIEWEYLPA